MKNVLYLMLVILMRFVSVHPSQGGFPNMHHRWMVFTECKQLEFQLVYELIN